MYQQEVRFSEFQYCFSPQLGRPGPGSQDSGATLNEYQGSSSCGDLGLQERGPGACSSRKGSHPDGCLAESSKRGTRNTEGVSSHHSRGRGAVSSKSRQTEGRSPQGLNSRFPELTELGLGSRDHGVPPALVRASAGQDSVTASRVGELTRGQWPRMPSRREPGPTGMKQDEGHAGGRLGLAWQLWGPGDEPWARQRQG